jgi:predicted DNA-binding transcriptional regulator AlpA
MNRACFSPQQPMTPELLTVEQFAQRLAMSRTTLFEWLKTGALVQGKHYFKVGRILRFIWDESLLLKIGTNRGGRKGKKQIKAQLPKNKRQLHSPSEPAVNLDYC